MHPTGKLPWFLSRDDTCTYGIFQSIVKGYSLRSGYRSRNFIHETRT